MTLRLVVQTIVLLAYYLFLERRDAEAQSFLYFEFFGDLERESKTLARFECANGSLYLSLSPLKEGRTGKDEYSNSSPKLGA